MNKGVTPVIAIVLLVFMTVSASILAFFWMTTMQTTIQGGAGSILEDSPSSDCSRLNLITLRSEGAVIQNVGCDNITKINALVDGALVTYDLDTPLAAGEATTIYFTTPQEDDTCVRVVNGDGTVSTICNDITELGCSAGRNPNNYPNLCSNPSIIVYPAEGVLIFELGFTDLHYAVNTGGNTWGSSIYLTTTNWTYYDVSYDRRNNPVVGYMYSNSELMGDVSYQFWTGSAWTERRVLMGDIPLFAKGQDLGIVLLYSNIPSMDSFPVESDNNQLDALFVWMNWTGSNEWDNALFYSLANQTTTQPYKAAFTGVNLTYPQVSVDSLGNAHMIYSNLSRWYVDGSSSLHHSVYDRENDSWSSPEQILSMNSQLLVPKMVFDNDNNALLVFLNYTKVDTTEYIHYSYMYYDGNSFEPPVYISYGKEATPDVSGGGRIILGYDNTQWVMSYSGQDDGEGHIPTFSRTYTRSSGLGPEREDVNRSEIVKPVGLGYAPMLNNREGGVIRVLPALSETTGYRSVYIQLWNGTGFGSETKVVNQLVMHPSCPFVYSYDGKEWHLEHESYGFAVFKEWEYESYAVLDNIKPINGELIVDLREELPETSYTNKLSLRMAAHPAGVKAVPDIYGNIRTISEWVYPDYCSQDCVEQVSSYDNNAWATDLSSKDIDNDADLRDSLILNFAKPEGAVNPKLLINLKETGIIRSSGVALIELIGSNNIRFFYDIVDNVPLLSELFTNWRINVADLIISVWDGNEWVKIESVGAGGALWNELLVPLGTVDSETLLVKLEFSPYSYYFNEIKVDYSEDESVEVYDLRMLLGSEEALLNDESYLVMRKGEISRFSFSNVICPTEKECSYIIGVKGYYEISPPERIVNLSFDVISKVLYLMANPIDSIRHCLKLFTGEESVIKAELSDTLVSLLHYFFD